jgi:triosephosphate isomerase
MSKKYVIGNWKMHFNVHESSLFLNKLSQIVPTRRDVVTVVAPTFLALQPLSLQINLRQMKLAAQNCYWRDEGAFTGEVSATMLRGMAQYVIIGHSERRHIFDETDRDIRFKVQAALRNGLRPILCVGETQFERDEGETKHVISDQVVSGLLNVGTDQIQDVLIAYEPVWAIGSGKQATPGDIAAATKMIRAVVARGFGKKAAEALPVLYGGSVNLTNAGVILRGTGTDGLLIGGASLNAHEFSGIVDVAGDVAKEEADAIDVKAAKSGEKK